jgi:hypothetical protein
MNQNTILKIYASLICLYFYTACVVATENTVSPTNAVSEATAVESFLGDVAHVATQVAENENPVSIPVLIVEDVTTDAAQIIEQVITDTTKHYPIQCIKRIDKNTMYIAFLPMIPADSSKNFITSLYDSISSCVKNIVEKLQGLFSSSDEENKMRFYRTTADNLAASIKAQKESRIIPFEACKKIQFNLTIDQSAAPEEERKGLLTLLSQFCDTSIENLSTQLNERAPHVAIILTLVNIEQDEYTEEDIFVEQDTYVEQDSYSEEDIYTQEDTYSEQDSYTEDSYMEEDDIYIQDDSYMEEDTYSEQDTYIVQDDYSAQDTYYLV